MSGEYQVYASGTSRFVKVSANSIEEARQKAFDQLTDREREIERSPNVLWAEGPISDH